MRKTLNKALLRKVAAKLRRLRHEEHYDQAVWMRRTDCGTAACIAGYAVTLAGWRIKPDEPSFDQPCVRGRKEEPVRLVAGRLLGVDPDSALFSGVPDESWPEAFAQRWWDAQHSNSGERPSRIAADLLDAIADGKVKL